MASILLLESTTMLVVILSLVLGAQAHTTMTTNTTGCISSSSSSSTQSLTSTTSLVSASVMAAVASQTSVVPPAATSSCSPTCGEALSANSSQAHFNPDTVLGGVVGCVLFIVVAIAIGIHIMLGTGWARRKKKRQIYAMELQSRSDARIEDPTSPVSGSGFSASSKRVRRTILHLCSVCAAKRAPPAGSSRKKRFKRNTSSTLDRVGSEKVDYIGYVDDAPDGTRKVPKPVSSYGSLTSQSLQESGAFDIYLHCHHCSCDHCRQDNDSLDCPFAVNLDRLCSYDVSSRRTGSSLMASSFMGSSLMVPEAVIEE